MDVKLIKTYLNNIEEWVIDEDKIVTYKSLSQSFGIHVNTAKQLLHTYFTKQKATNSFQISATYLIIGKLIDGSFNVTIVNEEDLKSTISRFQKITSEHIYSIQKNKKLKDIKLLHGIEKEGKKTNSLDPVIKCSNSLIKSKSGNKKSKTDNSHKTQTGKDEVKLLSNNDSDNFQVKEAKNKTENIVNNEETVKNSTVNLVSPTKNTNVGKSPKKTTQKDNKSKGNAGKGQGNAKKLQGNIANFFSNTTQKNVENSSNITTSKNDTPIKEEKEDIIDISPEVQVKQEDDTFKGTQSREKKKKKKKKGGKRKRIQFLSDSESSDSDDEETPVPEEITRETTPIEILSEEEEKDIVEETTRNKRKKRKVVDKTAMNEEGYLETKKEVVFETDSEDDTEQNITSKKEGSDVKKCKFEQTSEKVKVTTSNASKKQSSLLSFFKKN